VHRRRAAIAGVGFFAGLALLVLGISTELFLSVIGFVIMVVAAVTAIYSWQHVGSGRDNGRGGGDRAKAEAALKRAADKLLANTVIENYRVEIV